MDRIVNWYGREVLERRRQRIRDFWDGEERYLVTVQSTESSYRQLQDEDEMIELAPDNLRTQAELPGCNLPTFFADFGPVSNARYWGGKVRYDAESENTYVEHVAESVEEALEIERAPVDHPDMDAERAVRLFRRLTDRLQTDQLWLRMPDTQGPLNTAGLVIDQTQLLMSVHTEPDLVKQFLNDITDFLIGYVRHCANGSNGQMCGFIWPYTFYPIDRGISLTEDLMPLLSPSMYEEFGLPCLRRLAREFGGLHIHCCGEWGRHAGTLAESNLPIDAVEFHYPYTTIEQVSPLAPRTAFVPYIALDQQEEFDSVTEYYEYLLQSTSEDYRYWFAFAEDDEEAIEFAREHGF